MRAVLFDLDGTLINSWGLYLHAYAATLAPHLGRAVTPGELVARNPTSELRLLREVLDGRDVDPAALHREFLAHYAALHAAHFGGVYAGVPELLQSLRARGLRLGVVTGKSRGAWAITGPQCGLGAFDVVITDEDVAAPKPDAEGLRRALEALGLEPAQALYVGDSASDLAAARAAGVGFAAALWCRGEADRETFARQVRDGGAQAALHAPDALLALLESVPSASAASGAPG